MLIGDYRVVRELGRGGMGVVYLAEDPLLDRRVAIKVMHGYRDHPSARARFVVEARAIARLNHPNVVTVYRAGEHNGEPYLASEFVDGTPLDRVERPLPFARARSISLDLARGLAAAHREGIHHRDVKPGNAIVARDGTAKLLDFGLARFDRPAEVTPLPDEQAPPDLAPTAPTGRRRERPASERGPDATLTFTPPAAPAPRDATPSDLTADGTRMGTPRYMAPEAWRGERLTAASDVFSLGLVLWELFGGRHPLVGLDGDELEAAASAVPSLATASSGSRISPAIVAVVDRAVAADPAARFADAGELVAALEAAFAAVDAAAASSASEASVTEQPAAPPASGARIAAAVLGGGALLTAAVAFVVWPRGDGPSRVAGSPAPAADAAPVPAARALTSMGGCANDPAFIDGTTLAFTSQRGDDVDIMTLVPGGEPALAARSPGWDWRSSRGRHPGELLYVTDGDDGRERIKALSRATGALTEPLVGYTVATYDEAIYYATGDDLGWIRRLDHGRDERVAHIDKPLDQIIASPTGKHLAVVASDPSTPPTLCVVDLDAAPASGAAIDPAPTPPTTGTPSAAADAPTGANDTPAASAPVRCLDTVRMQTGRPAFSPDGARIYYASGTGLRVIELASGADALVADDPAASGGIAISPDGRRLVHSDCRSYGSIVAVGGGQVEVLIERGLTRSPVAAPDGALAYVEARPEGGTRIVIRRAGEAPRELASGDGELGAPAFTADGTRIAYALAGAAPGIVVRTVDGGAVERWTSTPGDRDPRWLADGSLAFTRIAASGKPGIWRQRAAGAEPTLLLDGALLQDRDATRVLAFAPGSLRWVDLATGEVTPITIPPELAPALGPARILPDGALVVTSVDQNAFLRLMPDGKTTLIHQHPGGQTIGAPTVFPDGRVAYRAEIWFGELHERVGRW